MMKIQQSAVLFQYFWRAPKEGSSLKRSWCFQVILLMKENKSQWLCSASSYIFDCWLLGRFNGFIVDLSDVTCHCKLQRHNWNPKRSHSAEQQLSCSCCLSEQWWQKWWSDLFCWTVLQHIPQHRNQTPNSACEQLEYLSSLIYKEAVKQPAACANWGDINAVAQKHVAHFITQLLSFFFAFFIFWWNSIGMNFPYSLSCNFLASFVSDLFKFNLFTVSWSQICRCYCLISSPPVFSNSLKESHGFPPVVILCYNHLIKC